MTSVSCSSSVGATSTATTATTGDFLAPPPNGGGGGSHHSRDGSVSPVSLHNFTPEMQLFHRVDGVDVTQEMEKKSKQQQSMLPGPAVPGC